MTNRSRPAAATRRPSGTTVAGGALLAVALVGLLCRYWPSAARPVLVIAAFSPITIAAGVAAAGVFALTRRRVLAIAAVATVAIAVAAQVPLYTDDDPPASAATLRVMTANLRKGTADAVALTASAGARADILAVQELTARSLRELKDAGLDETFPHRYVVARADSDGVGVWSRHPLSSSRVRTDLANPVVSTEVRVPGLSSAPVVAVARVRNPWRSSRQWKRDVDALASVLTELRASPGAVIVAGDLNSTTDMAEFRRLLQTGYRDAAEQAGAGWAPTFPGDMAIPSLLAIDHVLTLRCDAVRAATVTVPGSDHRALSAEIAIPAAG